MAKRYDNNDDIVGQRFGKLTVIQFLERDAEYRKWYQCKCDCGKESTVRRDQLLSGRTKTCGDCTMIVRENDYFRCYCHTGGSFIFDACDLEFVKKHRWLMGRNGYVCTTIDGKFVEFTRHVYPDESPYMFVDHINGDKQDNRRCNLRLATISQNSQNKVIGTKNTSGFKGVSLEKRRNGVKYRAQITKEYSKYHIGLFDYAEDAARAYDEVARQLHGEFACVNFPREGERGCRETV